MAQYWLTQILRMNNQIFNINSLTEIKQNQRQWRQKSAEQYKQFRNKYGCFEDTVKNRKLLLSGREKKQLNLLGDDNKSASDRNQDQT